MSTGFIKIHRKIWDSFIWQDPEALKLFIHLLMKANYKETEFMFNGKKQELKRGQLICGRKKLAAETRISENKIYRTMMLLESEHLIEQQKNNLFTLVSIVNYNLYQDVEQPNEQPIDNQSTTNRQPVDTSKEVKNSKKSIGDLQDKQKKQFIKPTVEQIHAYCQERANGIDAQYFFDRMELCGWVYGKNKQPVRDWKACIRTWESFGKRQSAQEVVEDAGQHFR